MRMVLAALVSATLQAAAIRGTVVENQTGKAVARATVQILPLPGTAGRSLSVRTNRNGVFEFGSLSAGSYLVKAARRGFLPMEYGQRRWNSAGTPVVLQENDNAALPIRLLRYGAISGTVVDENDLGLPDYGVAVYRQGQPPQLVAGARSDERGVYRVSGLEPGAYLVRSTAKQEEDEEYVPTFSRETLRPEQALMVPVYIEEETRGIDVHVLPGKLYTLAGAALTNPPGIPVKVTLVSELGRQTVEGPAFRFPALPAGPYELFVAAAENPGVNREQAAYLRVALDKDANERLVLQEVRETRFDFEPRPGDPGALQVLARRKDLAGPAPEEPLRLAAARAELAPGPWELLVTPPPGYYVSGLLGPGYNPAANGRPDGWNEVVISSFPAVRVSLSAGGGSLRGAVNSGGQPVPGAPVYLEAYDPSNRKRLTELRTIRTDPRGVYQFRNLPPGTYRLLATFEYQEPDAEAFDLAGARSVQIDAIGELQVDADLYSLP